MKKLVILLSGLFAFVLYAHQEATGVVKERMDIMSSLADHTKALVKMRPHLEHLDWAELEEIAASFQQHLEDLDGKFPEGSATGVSEASPRIWQEPEAFAERFTELSEAAEALAASVEAQSPDHFVHALDDLAASCKACHKDFRLKK